MTKIFNINNNIIYIINYFNDNTFNENKINKLLLDLTNILPNHFLKFDLIRKIKKFLTIKRKKVCFLSFYKIYLGDYLKDVIIKIVNTKNDNFNLYNSLINYILNQRIVT